MERDQNELRCPKCLLHEAQTVSPPLQPQKEKHPHSTATMKILTMLAHALQTCPHPYMCHCVSKQGHENESKTFMAQDTSMYGMMFCRCSHVSTKFTQIYSNHQTSQAKAKEFFQRHFQPNQVQSSLRLAVIKVQVIEVSASAKLWSATARSAARVPLTLRLRPSPFLLPQPPKTYIPSATSLHTDVCLYRAAGAVPLGDS